MGSAMSLQGGWLGKEQGPEGVGHTFESCRARQKSMCRACRDCGGGGSALGGGRQLVAGCVGVTKNQSLGRLLQPSPPKLGSTPGSHLFLVMSKAEMKENKLKRLTLSGAQYSRRCVRRSRKFALRMNLEKVRLPTTKDAI